MNLLIYLLILWIVIAPVNYLIVREDHLQMVRKWTQMDRLFWLTFCGLYGPILLVVIGLVAVFSKLSASEWGKREVKW